MDQLHLVEPIECLSADVIAVTLEQTKTAVSSRRTGDRQRWAGIADQGPSKAQRVRGTVAGGLPTLGKRRRKSATPAGPINTPGAAPKPLCVRRRTGGDDLGFHYDPGPSRFPLNMEGGSWPFPTRAVYLDSSGRVLHEASALQEIFCHAVVAFEGDDGLYEVIAIECEDDRVVIRVNRCPFDEY